jgi:beta-xylosidase
MRKLIVAAIVGLALAGLTGCVSPSTQIADPGVAEFGSNGWFVASSDTDPPGSGSSMPVWGASANDFAHQTKLGYILNRFPSWIDRGQPIWAPQIYIGVDGKTIAYYSAVNASTHHRCIGMAIASSGVTDFTDTNNPLCSPKGIDLIDPSLFRNGTSKYLLYKRDDLSNRAINITSAGADGLHPDVAGGTQLLSPTKGWETVGTYSSVEAPTMVRHGNYFYLFYSGGRYNSTKYGVGVARCSVDSGPICNYNSGKLNSAIFTGSGNYCGVGHQDVTNGASILWFHAYTRGSSNGNCDTSGKRYLGADSLSWDPSGWPFVQPGGPGI